MKTAAKMMFFMAILTVSLNQTVFSANRTSCSAHPEICALYPIGDDFTYLPQPVPDGTQGGDLALTKWLTYGPNAVNAPKREGMESLPYVYNDFNYQMYEHYSDFSLDAYDMFASPQPGEVYVYDKVNDYEPLTGNDSNVIRKRVAFDGDFEITTTLDFNNAPMFSTSGADVDAYSLYFFQVAEYSCDEVTGITTLLRHLNISYGVCETDGVPKWFVWKAGIGSSTGNCPSGSTQLFGYESLDSGIQGTAAKITIKKTGASVSVFANGQTTPLKVFPYTPSAGEGQNTLWSFAYVTNFGAASDTTKFLKMKDIEGSYMTNVESACMITPPVEPPSGECCQPGDPNYNKDEVTLDAAGMKASWNFDRKANCINAYFTLTGNTISTVSHICARKPGDTNVLVSGAGTFDGTNTVYKVEIPDSMNLGPQELEYAAAGDATWCLPSATP